MNLLTVALTGDGRAHLGDFELPLPRGTKMTGNEAAVGMRPENFTLATAGKGIPVVVELVEELGSDAFLHGSVQDDRGSKDLLVARVNPKAPPEKGETIYLAPSPEHVLWFDPATGARVAA
jgi:multiple sugar transport system ATP-binding protein